MAASAVVGVDHVETVVCTARLDALSVQVVVGATQAVTVARSPTSLIVTLRVANLALGR